MSIYFKPQEKWRTALSMENKWNATLPAGGPCSMHSSGIGIVLARADNPAYWAIGISTTPIDQTFAGDIQNCGYLSLQNWFNATGSNNLVDRATYYLAPAGGLTINPPMITGQIVQQIGIAVAPNVLYVSIGVPILL